MQYGDTFAPNRKSKSRLKRNFAHPAASYVEPCRRQASMIEQKQTHGCYKQTAACRAAGRQTQKLKVCWQEWWERECKQAKLRCAAGAAGNVCSHCWCLRWRPKLGPKAVMVHKEPRLRRVSEKHSTQCIKASSRQVFQQKQLYSRTTAQLEAEQSVDRNSRTRVSNAGTNKVGR